MSLIGKLSKYVMIPIYCNWLDFVNICHLDSSICNHIEREHFLSYIGNEHLTFRGMFLSSNKALSSFLNWICSRKIKPLDLNIRGNCTRMIEVEQLKSLSKLQILSITGNVNHYKKGIIRLLKSCTNLREIHLSACHLVTKDTVKLLADNNCDNLKVIDFPCHHEQPCNIDDHSMDYLFIKCAQLTSVTLENFENVTNECLIKMLQTCGHNLLELTLNRMRNINGDLLQSVGLLATKLQVFIFTSTFGLGYYSKIENGINPTVLSTLTNNCRDLKTCLMNFPVHDSYRTEYFTYLDTLTTNCVNLTSISICYVSDICVEMVAMKCRERLRHIALTSGTLRQSTFIILIQCCPMLQSLDIIGCKTFIDEKDEYFCADMKFLGEQLSALKHLRTLKMEITSIDEFPCELATLQLDTIELKYIFNRKISEMVYWKDIKENISKFKTQCSKKGSISAEFTVSCDEITSYSRMCMFYFVRRRLKH